MKKISTLILATLALIAIAASSHSGGVYKTNTGTIDFFSHTPVEDISAVNHKVKTAFSSANGKIQFSVLIKDFEFEKALMQEHFNENYMESTKYRTATFSGTITDIAKIKVSTDGTYTSQVTGKLTIKDVTKEVATTGTFTVKGGVVNAKAAFNLNPSDYNVKIPRTVMNKISDDIKISIDADYKHLH
ncbi:YceI family protein [Bacteroidia bacterium]|jgi:polyisoprenoid-binding protein YceI|nr:YceI family protein [Bacteroidota bacterium]MDA8929916.1 YceI family protein [Bacteroidia bacterium]MDA9111106.1 YceI family protein [Bacteroidia bacterium]